MNKLNIILLVLAVGIWSYMLGTVAPVAMSSELSNRTYLELNDRGCNDIIKHPDGRLVCEVNMGQEDEALYIIRKDGARDDY